ncbi:MAG: hypothetical protein B5M53_12385, partial [Candidatus Cloacimonas sp. 4484_209]
MRKTEFAVGLFIVLVLVAFGYMTLKVGKWSIKKEKLGVSNRYLSDGDEIKQTESEVELAEVARSVNKLLSDENIERVRETLQNLESLASKISLQVEENRENLKASIENIRQITRTLKKDIPVITARLIRAEEKANQILAENRENIKETIA